MYWKDAEIPSPYPVMWKKHLFYSKKMRTKNIHQKTLKNLDLQGFLVFIVFSSYKDGGATRNRTGE